MHANPDNDGGATSLLWRGIRVLWSWRIFLLLMLVLTLGVSTAVSLLLPVRYEASTSAVLPGSSSRGALTAILGDLGSTAAALLGGAVGDYSRYLAVMESRSMMEAVVDRFDLVTVYETADSPNPVGYAVEALRGNVNFRVDMRWEYLEVSVLDRSPERAAEMADYFVDQLNFRNALMMSQQARSLREFIEMRVASADSALNAARDTMRAFQEEHGIVELEEQTKAYLEMVAGYRGETLLSEIAYEALRLDYGDDNPTVRDAYQQVRAARMKERQIHSGAEDLMPVALKDLPDVARRYSELLQDVLVESAVVELARPLLEQARYDEQRRTEAVQVLDIARVPVERARPRRTLIIVSSLVSALIVLVAFVLTWDWWRRRHVHFTERLNQALLRLQ